MKRGATRAVGRSTRAHSLRGDEDATAGVVVGGQTLSLLLTLIATPVAYSFFDDISQFVGRFFGKKAVEAPAPYDRS